jgi:trehalose/maltose hydrolase-like predicted phosphorylase
MGQPADSDQNCRLCINPPSGEWVLSYLNPDVEGVGVREALLTVGNGYLATRGAAPEAWADGTHYPGTYVAGFYNRLISTIEGRSREDESIVNLPNWLPFTFRPMGGAWLQPGSPRPVHEHLALDLRSGVLHRELVVVDGDGRRTRLRQRRLVSMSAPHLAALETTLIAENWSGRLDVRSTVDGRVTNSNGAAFVGLAGRHLTEVTTGRDDPETVWLVAATTASRLRLAEAARTRIRRAGQPVQPERRPFDQPDVAGQELELVVDTGEETTIEKVVAVFTGRDRAIFEPLTAARQEVADAGTFDELLADHADAWDQLWRQFHLGIAGSERTGLAVNAQIFHLLQTLSPHTVDLDTGMPARGLHGEGYHGHIFWDEIFVFQFLNFRLPELTRALLQYRYRRLPQARRRAAGLGLRGALFPWQSGSDGQEETPRTALNLRSGRWFPDNSGRQYHVNLAISYDVWRYWQTTADLSFLITYGAELMIETARFWVSLATYDPDADRYDIRGVMGPDEFHDSYPDRPNQGIDNNAYVNVMVAWTLHRAVDAYELLDRHHGDELRRKLDLTDEELSAWRHIAQRLRLYFFDNGIIEQFEGYRDLAEIDLDEYRARYGDLGRLGLILQEEHDTPNRYKASKQADVLMLLYLFDAEELTGLIRALGYDFDPATIPSTVEFYLARTSHGSTLSRVAHAWVLARTNRRYSWQMLNDALNTDLNDSQGGTTREGIHLGAMGGALDILQRCYTGLDTRHDQLWLNPLLPDELNCLDLAIRYRGQRINLHVDHDQIVLQALPGPAHPTSVAIRGASFELASGSTLTLPAHGPVEGAGLISTG